jgi:hypothetical protein
MTNERPLISVLLSDRFRKDVKHLLKKYRHVRDDVQLLIGELEKGSILGDKISGTDFPVYKVRVQNRDIASYTIYGRPLGFFWSLCTLKVNKQP